MKNLIRFLMEDLPKAMLVLVLVVVWGLVLLYVALGVASCFTDPECRAELEAHLIQAGLHELMTDIEKKIRPFFPWPERELFQPIEPVAPQPVF